MKQIGDAVKKFLTSISDLFEVFDLSFFIAGILGATGVVTLASVTGRGALLDKVLAMSGDPLGVIALLVMVYIAGLISFALGRRLKRVFQWARLAGRRQLRRLIPSLPYEDPRSVAAGLVRIHGVDAALARRYGFSFEGEARRLRAAEPEAGDHQASPTATVTMPAGETALARRLWVAMRDRSDVAESLQTLKRYRVLAATYDGVATAAVLWSYVALTWIGGGAEGWMAAGGTLVVSWLCFRQATGYERARLEELIVLHVVLASRLPAPIEAALVEAAPLND
jgi:hypothetical protein